MKISGSKVLITGATGGIGEALVHEVNNKNGQLFITGRNREILSQLDNAYGSKSFVADLSLEDEAKKVVKVCVDNDIDICIFNAGLGAAKRFQDFTEDEIMKMFSVNLTTPTIIANEVSKTMVKKGKGHIVFMSSLAGKAVSAGSSIYSTTKFGLRALAYSMKADLKDTGVSVSVICPGFVKEKGMFAKSDIKLPPFVGTVSPSDVALATIKAIEKDLLEIDVAPLLLKVGSNISNSFPLLSAKLSGLLGIDAISEKFIEKQDPAQFWAK